MNLSNVSSSCHRVHLKKVKWVLSRASQFIWDIRNLVCGGFVVGVVYRNMGMILGLDGMFRSEGIGMRSVQRLRLQLGLFFIVFLGRKSYQMILILLVCAWYS